MATCNVFRVHIRPQERLMILPTLSYATTTGDPIPASDFEATIDGEDWVPGRDLNGQPFWTVADPDYPGPDDDSDPGLTDFTVTAGRTEMKIRYVGTYVTEIAENIQIVRVS